MGWSVGFDSEWDRDIGYGVPAYCDHPSCKKEIDRGLAYVCGGDPYGGDHGCGLFFCYDHLLMGEDGQQCNRCVHKKETYKRISKEHPDWIKWKLTDNSWAEWRKENPDKVKLLNSMNSIYNELKGKKVIWKF